MKWLFAMTLAACSVVPSAAALAQSAEDEGAQGAPQLNSTDHRFIRQAYSANKLGIRLGKLAQDQGSTQLVKDFGKRMAQDHALELDQLKRIADEQNLTLPEQLGPQQRAFYQRLASLSGQAFDDAYLQHMEMAHEHAIAAFRDELRNGANDELKAYAARALPVLRAHEQIADVIVQQSPGLIPSAPDVQPPRPNRQQGAPGQPSWRPSPEQGAPGQPYWGPSWQRGGPDRDDDE